VTAGVVNVAVAAAAGTPEGVQLPAVDHKPPVGPVKTDWAVAETALATSVMLAERRMDWRVVMRI
jgi:hypothetical protein